MKMFSQSVLRGSLRGLAIPQSPPLLVHVQQPQPLISLRSFSAQTGLRSVLVRSQSGAIAERNRHVASSFEQLGLGEEYLSFLSEHNLVSPTEIQARNALLVLSHVVSIMLYYMLWRFVF